MKDGGRRTKDERRRTKDGGRRARVFDERCDTHEGGATAFVAVERDEVVQDFIQGSRSGVCVMGLSLMNSNALSCGARVTETLAVLQT